MALRTAARYQFGLPFVRLMALNDDKTIPTPDRVIGGAGPFDFSGAPTPANVPLTYKLDAETAVTLVVDLSGGACADISAVTAAELRDAINLAAAAAEIVASLEAVTDRLQIAYNGTEAIGYMQVYGLCARLAMIGQGFGCQFIKTDTFKSLQETATIKAAETLTTTDAQGRDTEVITDDYRKGSALGAVDTARDPELRALIEGGSYDAVTGIYEAPTSESTKVYFFMEIFTARYREGSNKEGDLVGYVMKTVRSCVGSMGQIQHQRGWTDGNYNIVATSYTDESGVKYGDTQDKDLTVPQYAALDVENV
jgi:hypothetical protein